MKKKTFLFVCILFVFAINHIEAQIKSTKKTIVINNAPFLEIKRVSLVDENNDNIAEAEEICHFELQIGNTGKSIAKTVNVETSIYAGVKDAISFEHSNYIGNIGIGEEKTIKIPFTTGIGLKDGISSFKFIALEANNYDSKLAEFDLKVQSKQVPLAINWYYPPMLNTSVSDSIYTIKACIISSKSITNVSLLVNEIEVDKRSGLELSKTSLCENYFEKEIKLEKGTNIIKVVAKNTNEVIDSETRKIEFTELAYENRLALVIGNSKYETAPLRNPRNDAKAMATALRGLNFDVIEILDGDKDTIRKGIYDFHTKLKKNQGVGLFYYAGHGLQVKGENYLVPINHDIQQEYEIPDRAIKVNSVLAAMEDCETRMNIVILDACRDNPFARSMRSGTRGLAQIYAEGSGSIIAYATAPGSTAADGDGKNGLYTQELLKAIKTPGLEIGMVFRRVLTNVKQLSGGVQLPWTNSSIEGEFYFIK